jgi:hypothetical protein
MQCLYCKKRLWLSFLNDQPFCSKQHEAAYQDEMSAMRRLEEFTASAQTQISEAARSRRLAEIQRVSRVPVPLAAVPPLCGFVGDREYPRPVPTIAFAPMMIKAGGFAGRMEHPSSAKIQAGLSAKFAVQPSSEIRAEASKVGVCRLPLKRRHQMQLQKPAAFGVRAHRRRVGA